MSIFKKKKEIQYKPIRHIAFIMDGNGRWAKSRGLPRSLGHREGCKRIKEVAILCMDYHIQVMSLYCFSTENWKRPQSEIDYLFKLLEEFFIKELEDFNNRGCKIQTMGDISRLPKSTQEAIHIASEKTKANTVFTLNICLNYGGRDEITKGCIEVAKKVQDGILSIDNINESVLEEHMMCKGLPPVDVLVRTSGEQRLSNFLLWEVAYAEFIFVKVHWPSFKKKEFLEVLDIFSKRDRRFGGLKNE